MIAAPQDFPFSSCRLTTRLRLRLVACAAVLFFVLAGCQQASEPAPPNRTNSDPSNTTYVIEGSPVTLVAGVADEFAAPGASSRVITRVWGEPTLADLNEDGTDDAVLILIRSTGGSGTFYFLAAAIATPDGHSGTAGLWLGDRIEPKTIDVRDGKTSVRFMTRGAGQSFADEPNFETTRDFIYIAENQQLVEVAHDFEGEADPKRMTLEMQRWTWVKAVYHNDTVKEPIQKEAFSLTFEDGRVHGTTDCNSFNGSYTGDGHKIQFDDKMAATRKFCAKSQETEFVKMLLEVSSYFFTSKGQLILELKYDSGSMLFR